jgi:glycosyltransferase involved in cell wall biosynthesis
MVWFAAVLLVLTVGSALDLVLGVRRLTRLSAVPPRAPGGAPRVSVVVAARDEVRHVAEAARSLLSQDYPDFQVVFVDDRSTDGTGAVLDRLAAGDPRLAVTHVRELPADWLGKNHALQVGADAATGEWLLFTDADVHWAPDAVSRAVRYAEERGLDHLVAAPKVELPGLLLQAFGVVFMQSFLLFTRPWRVPDPRSRYFVGIGAFNLVRRHAYERVGGHRPIALRPDDDVKLGKILKRAGCRQELVRADGLLRVEWYQSFRELELGLEKNLFSGIEYRPLVSVLGGLAQLLVGVVPVALVWWVGGMAAPLFGAQIAVTAALQARAAREARVSPAVALLYPVAVALFVYLLWRTMVVNLRQGGITWRGTFYPLAKLKANRV